MNSARVCIAICGQGLVGEGDVGDGRKGSGNG